MACSFFDHHIKKINGDLIYEPQEHLSESQIKSMFSRMAQQRVSQLSPSGSQHAAVARASEHLDASEQIVQPEANGVPLNGTMDVEGGDSPPFFGFSSQEAQTSTHEKPDESSFAPEDVSEEDLLEHHTKDKYYNELLQQVVETLEFK